MKLKILLLITVILPLFTIAQVAVTYIPFQSLLGVSTDTENRFWLDYKLETNTFFQNLNMEISPKINIRQSEFSNIYLGSGVSFNPINKASELSVINGYMIDVGIRIKPLVKVKNAQLVFEISPYVNRTFTSGYLRTRLGIAWNFSKQ
jgi:hypothetical protein